MSILLTGATGQIGGEVAKRLAAAQTPFTALVRDPAKASGLAALGARLHAGGFEAPASVEAAARGCEAAFILLPLDERLAAFGVQAIAACKRAGVKRIVYLSAIGANTQGEGGFFSYSHAADEGALELSGLGCTVLKPNFFMQNWLGSAGSIKGEGKIYNIYGTMKASYVDTRDIAAVAARCLLDPSHAGKSYMITGPRALSPDEVAATIGGAIGKRVDYVNVPRDAFESTLRSYGLPHWQAKAIVDLDAHLKSGASAEVTDVVERIGGSKPIAFEQFAREHAGAFK